jgi:hypothetical protein
VVTTTNWRNIKTERKPVHIGRVNSGILSGEVDLSSWDMEELRRGQKKDRNGRWVGRPPKVVPKKIHDELVKRTLDDARRLFNDNLLAAVQVLIEIVENPDTDTRERLKGIQMIVDRAMGKAPETVKLNVDAPWVGAINAGIVSIGETIDADSHDVDDEEEWEDEVDG